MLAIEKSLGWVRENIEDLSTKDRSLMLQNIEALNPALCLNDPSLDTRKAVRVGAGWVIALERIHHV